ncbi:MAG: ankyrin repeat domain-containing protein [Candidatus Electrothrix aestuarii]|uniref:Ankyrin repeat domain-containing protein n=1 Tax=Candidatus Electrothrix aestuarii TaxID=3062594 RepID=A0AAU8LRG1_9BACT|nr:ankyrin repeat domain-containing protein [Candidatus Electrothrix aestuarii]
MKNISTIWIFFFALVALFYLNSFSFGRELLQLDKKYEDILNINGISISPSYISDCNMAIFSAEMSDFHPLYSSLLEEYSDEEKIFHILTTLPGLKLFSQYKVESKKDFCFLFIPKGNAIVTKHVIKIPFYEINKIKSRDFSKKDIQLVKDLKGRPYDIPPYPLINLFKRATINKINFPDDEKEKGRLKKNVKATKRYHKFLENFQFPSGTVNEASVEDVYAKYLTMSKEIYNCILDQDIKCVKGYYKMGFDINSHPLNYEPILTSSVRSNNLNIVEFLLKNGADPNIRNYKELTPLMIAVVKQYFDIIKLLIKYGADPNIKTSDGVRALDLANLCKSKEITSYLASLTTAPPSLTKNADNPQYVLIEVESICGLFGCSEKNLTISGGPGDFESSYNGASRGAIHRGYSGLAGTYHWSIQIDDKMCFGTVDVSGKKRNLIIRLYKNCSDAGIAEF